ncbi:MAG TPA: hypothetical protein VIS07_10430 [Candidatus Binatia bacterium]
MGSVRAQAAKVVQQLERRIEQLQAEIAEMRAQADSWRQVFGGSAPRRGRPPGRTSGRSGGKRLDWNEVLRFVPKRFGVEDVMKHPGAAAKGRAQVYPALNRWENAKLIRRVGKGVYEKVEEGGEQREPRAKRGAGKKRSVARRPRAGKKAAAARKKADETAESA